MASIADPRNRRWRQPLDQQLPATARWVATLPAEIQPLTLLQRLPRIANDLARVWHDDPELQLHLEELLNDRRGAVKDSRPKYIKNC
jgi:hypothetical protein